MEKVLLVLAFVISTFTTSAQENHEQKTFELWNEVKTERIEKSSELFDTFKPETACIV